MMKGLKLTALLALGLMLSGQLLANEILLCKANCAEQKISAGKHHCCPAKVAKSAAPEKLAEKCFSCFESREVPATGEKSASVRVDPSSVSSLKIVLAENQPNVSDLRPKHVLESHIAKIQIPITLHRFLI